MRLCWAGLQGLRPGLREWRSKRPTRGLLWRGRAAVVMGRARGRALGCGAKGEQAGAVGRGREWVFLFPSCFQNQFQIQIEFWIYFSTQIKISHFGRFSENKLYNFLNPFIFKFSFLSFILLQSHFYFLLQKQFKPLNQIHQMQEHVCTNMLLNLMMNLI